MSGNDWWNGNVFSCHRKEETDGAYCTSSGRVFQKMEAATGNERRPAVDRRYGGMCSCCVNAFSHHAAVSFLLVAAIELNVASTRASTWICDSYLLTNDSHTSCKPVICRILLTLSLVLLCFIQLAHKMSCLRRAGRQVVPWRKLG